MSVAEEARRLAFGAPARPAEGSVSLGRIALIAAICATPVVLYLPFLAEPFMRDEGFYAAAAQQSYEDASELNYYSVDIGRWINTYYDYVGRVYYADVYKLRLPGE